MIKKEIKNDLLRLSNNKFIMSETGKREFHKYLDDVINYFMNKIKNINNKSQCIIKI